MSGEIILYTQDGEKTLKAPDLGVTLAGTRRFAYCVSDVFWVAVHRTNKTTEAEVEKEVIIDRINPLLMNKEVLH